MSDRPSFAKNKIGQYSVGATGITGTQDTQINPTAEAKMVDGNYSASDTLFNNIDKLGAFLKNSSSKVEEINIEEDIFENMSEEEAAEAFTKSVVPKNVLEDNFCRNCGTKYQQIDNFCGQCGTKRK